FATTISFRGSATRGTYPLRAEVLDEAETRAALARRGRDLELVGDRADDGDAESAFGELPVVVERRRLVRVEALAVVADLDPEPVRRELVADFDVALAARSVRMAHGVRDGLGQRELEIGHRVVRDRPELREPGQGQPAKGDVLRLRRDAELDGAGAVARGAGGKRVTHGLHRISVGSNG